MDKLKVVLDPGAICPERAHEADAGYDLYSRDTCFVFAGEHVKFDTGVHVAIPRGYVGFIRSKSGLMGIDITSDGTIDSEYTGSIKAVLFNHGKESYLVRKGDKISQLVLLPIETPEIEIVEQLEDTERGNKGFGSTGR